MKFLEVNFENEKTIIQSFDLIAEKFGSDVNIIINENYYRIADFEFYVYSHKLQDLQTHQHKIQLEHCKFYLHSSGIDITFGDGENYGGILLRGIVKLYDGAEKENGFMKQQFDGPQIVATELFSNLYPLNSTKKNEISLIDINGQNQDSSFFPAKTFFKTKRVGLSSKPTDKEDFYKNLQLRYIIVLPVFPKFKQKIKGIESLVQAEIKKGKLTIEDAKEILGYKKPF